MQSNTLAPKTPRITSARVGRGGKRGYHGQRARLEYRNVHQPGKRQRDDNVSYDFKNDSMEDSFFNAFI